jgi:hypothetical protein
MNVRENASASSGPVNPALNRRQFFAGAGMAAAAAALPIAAKAATPLVGPQMQDSQLETGNGQFTYRVVKGWGALPEGTKFGGTHGAIAVDKAGLVYVSTQSETGVLVYSRDGKLLHTIATDYPEVHSLVHAEEAGTEYFYTVVQKGTPKENWLFLKMKIDGTVVQKITAPPEAGFKQPNEWRITAAVPAPSGEIFIANGYGDSRIFRFDKAGNYKGSFTGKGGADGECNCCHGMSVDTRYDQPLLFVCDRENRRLTHYDFDGKFVRNTTLHLRRPCQISFHGDHAIISELEGRVTILDKDNAPVAFLGDNPHKDQWANYKVPLADIAPVWFSAAHGCYIDSDASIYVSDWNVTGRVSKLARVNA